MRKIIQQIPNFITTLNLVSGTLSVIFAIDGHLIWAGVFICVAAVFDFLDGFTARLLNAHSEIGKQLDSLSDLISFGLAPGTILFTLLEFSLFGENQPIYEINAQWYEWLILLSSFLLPAFGAIRLARFNLATGNEPFFRGLPIPANGLLWASFGLMLQFPGHEELFKIIFTTKNLLFFEILTASLMVSNLPMFTLKIKSLKISENWYRYLFLLIALLLFSFFNVYGLALTIGVYILLNFIFYLLKVKF
ncbi:MAG: CDP-alcohol phosphatidyltransferase family protein [Prolixibacteraceae bacterium]|nr:CDP-alcohol phosphatidyltransferase family protein [Prolixibacteraceae bacterium]